MIYPFFKSGDKTISAGTTEIAEIELPTDAFIVTLMEFYADARADLAYEWFINGDCFSYNHVLLVGGKTLIRGQRIKVSLRLTNSGTEAKTVSYYITGFKRLK